MFELNISTRDAKLTVKEIMTTGSVGMTLKMTFSADWSDLHRVACFENGHRQIVIDEDEWTANKVEIPHEMFFTAGAVVKVGVYGYRIENGEKVIAIPTIYAELGKVERGANGLGDATAKATPTIIEKLIEDVEGKQDRLVAGQNITIQDNVISASGGGSLDVDTEMSDTSENAVQNKVIKGYVDDALQSASEQVEQFFELKSDLENDVNEIIDGVVVKKTEISSSPTIGDENPVSSDGVARSIGNLYTIAVESFVAKSDVAQDVDSSNENPVSSKAVADSFTSALSYVDGELENKQDILTAGSGISIVNNVISATGGGGSAEWEHIGKVIVGYTLLTSEPSDFTTNFSAYYKNTGTDDYPIYSALTSAETFEIAKYYEFDSNGKTTVSVDFSNYKKVFADIETSAGTSNGNIYIYFYRDGSFVSYSPSGFGWATGKRYQFAEIEKIGNKIKISGQSAYQYPGTSAMIGDTLDGNVNELRFVGASNARIPANSTFDLFGVK